MTEPLITTVIPAYRRPATLRRAITSVLSQTFSDFRVCVYDDASGDETPSVVEELRRQDSRVEIFRRENNVGFLANFLDGANRVKTPFFSLLSDDDVMLPGFFERALEGFRQCPQAAMSILTTLRVRKSGLALGAPILKWPEGLLLPPVGMLSILRFGNPDLPGLLIRREAWEQLGGWDTEIGTCCDMDFELRAAARFPIFVCKQLGGVQLIHDDSITSKSCLNWVWPAIPLMANKVDIDASLSKAARQEAAGMFAKSLKKNLITRGMIRSAIGGRWDDAERATNLLFQQGSWSQSTGLIRPAFQVLRRLPGITWILRSLLGAETSVKVIRNLHLQWRFRPYLKAMKALPLKQRSAKLGCDVPVMTGLDAG